jgi:hypothetical protein
VYQVGGGTRSSIIDPSGREKIGRPSITSTPKPTMGRSAVRSAEQDEVLERDRRTQVNTRELITIHVPGILGARACGLSPEEFERPDSSA